MVSKSSIITTLILSIVILSAAPLFGQATFAVASSSTTGADIGVTELTGAIGLTVISGGTVAAPLFVRYSATITNNSASEISVLGTGGLSGIASSPALDRSSNTLRIDVPAGGTASNQIRIAGVRVALAGQNYTNVTATISTLIANGNAIVAGQGTVVVLGSIQQPFAVDLPDNVITPGNGSAVNADVSITVSERYAAAFSGSVGQFGQTVPVEIRISPFPSIPPGVTLTYAATATSMETGASFATVSGQPETVPRSDGSTSAIYLFMGAANSDQTLESFEFHVTVTVHPPTSPATLSFQVTMMPIGIAVPNSQFPSTDIPRFIERPLPDEADLQPGTVQLAFPFLSQSPNGTYTGIALTNPNPYRVNVSLSAFDAGGKLISGPGVTNPVNLQLPRSGQLAKLATDIFGANFNASTAGTIVATGSTSVLPGFYLEGGTLSGQGLDGATAELIPTGSWVWPVVSHQSPSPSTVLQIFNPGNTVAKAILKLYNSAGSLKATANLTMQPGATLIQDARTVFAGFDLNSITGGYVTGLSDAGLVVSENFGNGLDSNVLRGQQPVPRSSLTVAHFVSGPGYATELNFVNTDPFITEYLFLTALDNSGAVIGGGPLTLSLSAGQQFTQTVDQLFPTLGSSFTTGYIRVDIEPSSLGPFSYVPPMVGSVRFTSAGGTGSTALPLFIAPLQDFVYAHIAQNQGYYTGVAIINPNATATTVNLQVFTADGIEVGSASTQLQPGQKVAKLLYELVPSSAGQLGGYIRVQSALPVVSFSVFGTVDGKLLSAVPPQNAK
jgi:hypothetical protein